MGGPARRRVYSMASVGFVTFMEAVVVEFVFYKLVVDSY